MDSVTGVVSIVFIQRPAAFPFRYHWKDHGLHPSVLSVSLPAYGGRLFQNAI